MWVKLLPLYSDMLFPALYIALCVGPLDPALPCPLSPVCAFPCPPPVLNSVLPSFSSNYKNRVWRNEVLIKKQERTEKKDGEATTMFTRSGAQFRQSCKKSL